MANHLWDRFERVAATRGDAPAVIHGARVLGYGDLLAETRALAAGLSALGPGDRVVIAAENSADILIWVAALWHRGAIPALVHADAPSLHLAHAAEVTAPAFAVGTRNDWPEGLERCAPDDRPAAVAAPTAPTARDGVLPGSIVFTSGSTGRPKGVTQAGATLIDGAARMARLMGYQGTDRILCPIPFAFDYGWGQALSCLLEGVTLVLPEPRNGFGLCAALAEHRPTVLAGVPAVFADLTAGLAPIRETARDSIRLITNTGSKIPAPVFAELCTLFPQAEISLNYGLTETYRSASLPRALARVHPDAVGHAVEGAELLVLRPDGSRCDPEEEGEIVHRGAGTFLGYWNDPVRTAEVLRPDPMGGPGHVVYTGDLGRIGADGFLRIHGRHDRQMKCMGVRVSPDEIEAILLESCQLAEVGVIALPHDILGHLIVACVVPKGTQANAASKGAQTGIVPKGAQTGAMPREVASAGSAQMGDFPAPAQMAADTGGRVRQTVQGGPPDRAAMERALLKALKTHARSRMSQYMQPRRWEIFDDLPRTRSAKVDYPTLRALVEARE